MKQKMIAYSFYIDPESVKKLKILSRLQERTASAMARWLINREWDRFVVTDEGQRALAEYQGNGNETQE